MVENLSPIQPYGADCEQHLPVVPSDPVTELQPGLWLLLPGACWGIIDLPLLRRFSPRLAHNLSVDPLKVIQILARW
jgi:hypothetical protein